ncbi:MAG: hypothetical protein K1X26_01055 [Chitinophagales bacterium]|nr:hypothetical protein [Chitinophagales bacterium]MCB9074792.1 hypothetical protein [Chitinophagales bacterium]HMW94013.1 hypothetical protein [Chitinophagales bacterium]HMY41777.1 hypothetical protein [Chitinophagales bacterium]HMZ68104.1 hypothetical protein [Chitinophagales bacterium]
MMQKQLLRKWLLTLVILMLIGLVPAFIQTTLQKTWIYFDTVNFFIAFIFWVIIYLAEQQTAQKKMGYTLGAIGIKFILTIVAVIGYFVVFKEKTTPEIMIVFIITSIYYIIGYFFLYRLTNLK